MDKDEAVTSVLFQGAKPAQTKASMDKERRIRNQIPQKILRIAIIHNNDSQHLLLLTCVMTRRSSLCLGSPI